MEPTTTCPSCGTAVNYGWPALVAPFIADYVLQGPVARCRLLECDCCDHRFFDQRFTDAETARLYAGYRGPAYFAVRHQHEPWYSRAYNRGIGHDPARVQARKASLGAFLSNGGLIAPLGAVLDFGGDSGQLIPAEWARDRYVHDLSDVPAAEGVHKLADAGDLEGRTFDLVLLTHVLEHASDPMSLMERIRKLLQGMGHVYVEVPLERPWVGLLGRGSTATWYLDQLSTKPGLLRLMDFYSSAFRIKAGFYPPFGFPKLHEHIHFFSGESLRQLLGRAGFRITHMQQVASSGLGKPDSLACLAAPEVTPKE